MQKVNIFTKDESKNVLNEIRLLTSLNSLYIVKFKDSFLGSDHKAIFLIMEFVSGGDLSCLLK